MMELQLLLLYLTQLHQPLMEQLLKLEEKSVNGVPALPTPVRATETALTIIRGFKVFLRLGIFVNGVVVLPTVGKLTRTAPITQKMPQILVENYSSSFVLV